MRDEAPRSPTGRYKMCERKRAYGERQAKRLAHSRRQRAYRCPLCEHWHLTTIDRESGDRSW